MIQEVLPISEELENLINEVSRVNDITLLYDLKCKVRKYILQNKKLKNELNTRIKTFEKISKTSLFINNLENFSKILKEQKNDYPRTLPTDDVDKIFYFPTMGRRAICPPYYDSVYKKPLNGTYELYYALKGLNNIEIFPKEVFEDTKDCIDFYILDSLNNYKILPQHIGSVRLEEYCCEKTLYRLDDCEDKFLICWLRAVLLGVLNQLMIYSKNLSEFENKFPVVLQYFDETKDFTLDNIPFNLTKKEIEFLIKIASPATTQDKKRLRGYVSKINIKAREIIKENIITDKTSNKLYRINENIVIYKD